MQDRARKDDDGLVEVYEGPFGEAQAERLLWRAGFGPRPGEAGSTCLEGPRRRGRLAAGPRPRTARRAASPRRQGACAPPLRRLGAGSRLVARPDGPDLSSPRRAHDARHARLVRDLVRGCRSQRLMLDQHELLRRHALGPFRQLLLDVTPDPAMLVWLNGVRQRTRLAERELRPRGDGAVHARRRPRRLHRGRRPPAGACRSRAGAYRWSKNRGPVDFHFDPSEHDDGMKRVFGKRGTFGWSDACRLCLEHPGTPVVLRHASSGRTSSRRLRTQRRVLRSRLSTSSRTR